MTRKNIARTSAFEEMIASHHWDQMSQEARHNLVEFFNLLKKADTMAGPTQPLKEVE